MEKADTEFWQISLWREKGGLVDEKEGIIEWGFFSFYYTGEARWYLNIDRNSPVEREGLNKQERKGFVG